LEDLSLRAHSYDNPPVANSATPVISQRSPEEVSPQIPSIIDPAVVLDPERPNPTYPSHTAMEGRLADERQTSADYAATKITAVHARGSTVELTLSEGVDKAIAEKPENYLVTINGGSYVLSPGAVSYDPIRKTVTLRGIPFSRADQVSVTVVGLWDLLKHIPGVAVICRVQNAQRSRRARVVLTILAAAGVGLLLLMLAVLL
jgi:hypothetical protein